MPKVKPNEIQDDFVARCIPIVLDEGTAEDQDQATAICFSLWRDRKSNMSVNDLLLENIKARQEKRTEFNYGILTADQYVKSVQDCVGSELCYRYAATKHISFDDYPGWSRINNSKGLIYNNGGARVLAP